MTWLLIPSAVFMYPLSDCLRTDRRAPSTFVLEAQVSLAVAEVMANHKGRWNYSSEWVLTPAPKLYYNLNTESYIIPTNKLPAQLGNSLHN